VDEENFSVHFVLTIFCKLRGCWGLCGEASVLCGGCSLPPPRVTSLSDSCRFPDIASTSQILASGRAAPARSESGVVHRVTRRSSSACCAKPPPRKQRAEKNPKALNKKKNQVIKTPNTYAIAYAKTSHGVGPNFRVALLQLHMLTTFWLDVGGRCPSCLRLCSYPNCTCAHQRGTRACSQRDFESITLRLLSITKYEL